MRNSQKRYKAYFFLKRFFDIFLSLLAILILSWLYILVSLLILIFSGYPIFYKDKRVGKNGKTIYVLKYRTMYNNAEERIETYLSKEELEKWKTDRKIENDPRITKIGKILRKTSIDELPQLFNIFIGDMSIVGPRPVIEKEYNDHYTEEERKLILSVRPGLISYWSVHGRSNVEYKNGERQKLELEYFNHHSIWFDFWIVLSAIPAVLSGQGAK